VQKTGIIWRIDDRLIHGQIIIGWCGSLPIKLMVVCDDEIASNDFETKLLITAAPPNIKTEILTLSETVSEVNNWQIEKKLILALIKSPHSLKTLLDKGLKIHKVNVGGIHYQNGRKEYLPYIYLTADEVRLFSDMMAQKIYFECQDLPNSSSYDLKKIIGNKA
jgi:PTS system mannose-specific IIB component